MPWCTSAYWLDKDDAFLQAVDEGLIGVNGRPRRAPHDLHARIILRGHLAVELVDFVDNAVRLAGGAMNAQAQPGAGATAINLGDDLVVIECIDDGPAPADVYLIFPVQFLALVVDFLLLFVAIAPGYINFTLETGNGGTLPWDRAVEVVNSTAEEDKAGVPQVSGFRRWDGKKLVDDFGFQSSDIDGVCARVET